MGRHRMGRRGVVMAFSLGLITVLATLGVALLTRSLNDNLLGHRSADRLAAFHLAEGAVDRASINLRTPTDATDDVLTQTLSTGSYTIESTSQLSATTWRATVRGNTPTEQRRLEAVYQLTPQSVFQFSLFGDQQVSVSGSAQTDSYDSRLGAYQDNPNEPGYNKTQDGNVGTNSTSSGGITVSGSIFIEGQVAVGPGVDVSNPGSVITGYDPAFITGDPKVVSETQTFPMPAVSVPPGMLCIDEALNGGTTTLSQTGGTFGDGVYCYHDLTIQGNATLTASGPVTVYFTGQLIAKGNSTIGVPSSPKDMLVLMTPASAAVLEEEEEEGQITGSAVFYGAMYGPEATITITGSADVYGAIIADRISVTGSAAVHYDKCLDELTTIANTYQRTLVSWRDLN